MTDPGPDAELTGLQERHAGAWRAHDLDAITSLHAPDARFCAHGDGTDGVGRTALREAALETFGRSPNSGPSRGGCTSAPTTGCSNGP